MLGLVGRLAGPLLAGLAGWLPRPRLGLRLPALFALLLLALAHQFLLPDKLRLGGFARASESIDYMAVPPVPIPPLERFHALPQVSHDLGLIG